MTTQTKWVLGICLAILAIFTIIIAPLIGYSWYRIYDARQGLHHEHSYVKRKAIRTLTQSGDRKSYPEIRQLLYDKESSVRRAAAYYLGHIGDKESLPTIRQMLKDKDTCYTAVIALGEINDKESIPQIKELLKDEDEGIRQNTKIALRQLGVSEEEINKAKEKK